MSTARNDVTGDKIQTKGSSQTYRDNYDLIFRKEKSALEQSDLVAVYGTLKAGRSNSRVMERAKGTLLGESLIKAKLYKYCTAFPAISLEPYHDVLVEVYKVADIGPLDSLEGYPHFYGRSLVDTGFGKAWVYYLDNKDLDKLEVIENGIF